MKVVCKRHGSDDLTCAGLLAQIRALKTRVEELELELSQEVEKRRKAVSEQRSLRDRISELEQQLSEASGQAMLARDYEKDRIRFREELEALAQQHDVEMQVLGCLSLLLSAEHRLGGAVSEQRKCWQTSG